MRFALSMTIWADGCPFYNINELCDNKQTTFNQQAPNYEASYCVHPVQPLVSGSLSTLKAKQLLNLTLCVCGVCFICTLINSCCRARAEPVLDPWYFVDKASRLTQLCKNKYQVSDPTTNPPITGPGLVGFRDSVSPIQM